MSELMLTSLWRGGYFFVAALVLANLEVQIEGKNGWASELPTWRWGSPFILKLIGKPITGYHVYMNALLLLLTHLPVVYQGFTWERESELLCFYFLFCVSWDFLWFACNPHFGWRKFRRERVWWYPRWFCGFPVDYYVGILVSFSFYMLPLFIGQPGSAAGRAVQWALLFGESLFLTAAASVIAAGIIRAPAPSQVSRAPSAD